MRVISRKVVLFVISGAEFSLVQMPAYREG